MNNQLQIEIQNYRPVEKGCLKGFFTLIIQPFGQKVYECRHFEHNNMQWFTFPQRKVEYPDGRKAEYYPYISFTDKQYLEKLKEAVIAAITKNKPQENGYVQKNSKTHQRRENPVSSDTSFDFEGAPF